jgi:hypothetical protein
MEKNQELTEEHEALSSTLDDLSNCYNYPSVDYESLRDDLLSRKQELESLKDSYDKLAKEKASLFAEQTEKLPDEFVPPCLKCLERSNADSTNETSSATVEILATATNDNSNPSTEEFVAISNENSRLKDLLEQAC